MPGFPQYQGRVWKWDFKPDDAAKSATRKGWRIFAFAPGQNPPGSTPIPATAFFCYDKSEEPSGNPAKWLAAELKKFLGEENIGKQFIEEEAFRRFLQDDGQTRSICMKCCETLFVSSVMAELEMAEASHRC